MNALDDMIAKIEAGDESWVHLPRLPELHTDLVWKAWAGSLDAARALHDALLPGWDLLITTYEDGLFEASVSEPLKVQTYDGICDVIARAWLLAILRAYRSQVQG